jgi:hypothetical protein
VGDDEVYLGWETATFDTPDPGEGKTVTMNEAYLYGADAASYQIDTLNTTTATIGTYLIVDFTVDLKICDGTVGADVTEWWLKTLDGHVEFQSDVPNDEDVQLRWESVTFDTPDPGEGKTVTMNGAYLYGTSTHSDLYRIYAVNTTTGTIEPPTAPQPLVVDFGCDSAYYSGSVCHADVVEYQLSDPNGQIIFGWAGEPDEDVHLGWDSTSIVDPSVGTNKTVIMNGAYLYGDDAGKYQIVQVNTSTTYVEPRPLVVDFTVDTKTYDGTTYAEVTNYSLTTSWLPGGGVVAGDEVYLAWESATFDTPEPGEGKTVTMNGAYLTGPDAGNYQIETVNTTTGIIELAAIAP